MSLWGMGCYRVRFWGSGVWGSGALWGGLWVSAPHLWGCAHPSDGPIRIHGGKSDLGGETGGVKWGAEREVMGPVWGEMWGRGGRCGADVGLRMGLWGREGRHRASMGGDGGQGGRCGADVGQNMEIWSRCGAEDGSIGQKRGDMGGDVGQGRCGAGDGSIGQKEIYRVDMWGDVGQMWGTEGMWGRRTLWSGYGANVGRVEGGGFLKAAPHLWGTAAPQLTPPPTPPHNPTPTSALPLWVRDSGPAMGRPYRCGAGRRLWGGPTDVWGGGGRCPTAEASGSAAVPPQPPPPRAAISCRK